MMKRPEDGRDGVEKDAGESAGFVTRYFRPTNLAVANRISIGVLVAIIATLGIISYRTVPKEASPEITIPMISVSTVYPGVAPKDMETLVSRVIEEELNKIPEITDLTSVSDQGYSNVTAEFASDMDMDEALQKVREKIDLAKPELPVDAEDPVISEFNFAEFPIMQVNISGAYDLVRLKEVAEDLQDRLEQIPSMLEVRLSGGLERVVKVDVDLALLKFYGVAFGDVIEAVRGENVNVPGGVIDVGSQEYLVRVDGEFRDPRVIEDIVVIARDGRPTYVRDVATVDFGFEDRNSYARLDGHPVVTLDIVKRSGENIIETSDAVKAAIDELSPTFPASTVIKITSDQSSDIREMVSSLENNIISGLVLVVAVLLFFLGVRNASFVGISIPLSMLLSFIIMNAMGLSMNMVVLFSLILALGMLVDNAIVVVENIYRHMEQGFKASEAARRGAGEVAVPIISSTLTTLAAFFPLLFWPGITGEFMKFLPQTLIITLSSSLFVALVAVPTLCAMFMRVDGEQTKPLRPAARWTMIAFAALFLLAMSARNPLAGLLLAATAVGLVTLHRAVLAGVARWFQDRALPRIIETYQRQLNWALHHRGVVLGSLVASFVGAIALFGVFNAGIEFFPESIPPATVYARVDVPSGTSPEFTDGVTRRVEERLRGIEGMADAESIVATVGSGSAGGLFASSAEGSVAVNFVDFDQRSHDVFETLRLMQESLRSGAAGADLTVEKPANGPPTGKPINIEIVGPDVDQLKRHADRALAVLKTDPVYARLEGLESDMARGRPELVVEVDRETAALYDLSTAEVGSTVRTAIQGTEAAKFRSGNDEYDIVVRLAEAYRGDLESLRDLTVVNDGRQVPLPSVARWRVDEGLGTVRRKDLDRVATISSDVRAGEQSNAVLTDVQAVLADFATSLPAGYSLRYTGQQEDQAEAMRFLSTAFLIALALIALILMSQFNSVLKPLIIMTSVIMSTVGVLLGLIFFRMPFGIIMTGVGVISLAGVVVNNAIVLIDYIDLLRERDGLSRNEALLRAGATRFRPVVLTAITTVLGLVPLAVGFNFDFFGLYSSLSPNVYWGGEQAAWWGPMAIAVIAGLSFATILTLVVVPVLYAVVDDMGLAFQRHFTAAGVEHAVVADGGQPAAKRRPRRRRIAAAFARFQRSDGAPDGVEAG
jgi:multidrug efflux pump subunit AcrB